MAQTTSKQSGRVVAGNALVSIPNSGPTFLLEVSTEDIDYLGISLLVAGFALAGFQMEGRMSPDDAYQVVKSSAWGTPGGFLIASSSDLTTLAVGSGWAYIDVRGFYSVRFKATGSNATPSTVTEYATGKGTAFRP